MINAVGLNSTTPPALPLSETRDERVSNLMQSVASQKEEKMAQALKGRTKSPMEAVLIGGNLFTMGALAFQGAELLKPSLSAISAIQSASMIFSAASGAINIFVSFVMLKCAIQALKNGDKAAAARLGTVFVLYFSIGLIMLLAYAVKLGALTTFLGANPWVLPILFFVAGLPTLGEVALRIIEAKTGKAFGAAILDPKKIENAVEKLDLSKEFKSEEELYNHLGMRFEKFSTEMGIDAAIATFRLLATYLKKGKKLEECDKELKIAQGKIKEWNHAQYVRATQRALNIFAFILGLGLTFIPSMQNANVQATETFAMSGANAIPLYMDTFWPFKRNSPIITPKTEYSELTSSQQSEGLKSEAPALISEQSVHTG